MNFRLGLHVARSGNADSNAQTSQPSNAGTSRLPESGAPWDYRACSRPVLLLLQKSGTVGAGVVADQPKKLRGFLGDRPAIAALNGLFDMLESVIGALHDQKVVRGT